MDINKLKFIITFNLFDTSFGYVSSYNLVMFLFLLCNKILLYIFLYVSCFCFCLICFMIQIQNQTCLILIWVRKSFSFGCFHECERFHQKIKFNFHVAIGPPIHNFLEYNGQVGLSCACTQPLFINGPWVGSLVPPPTKFEMCPSFFTLI